MSHKKNNTKINMINTIKNRLKNLYYSLRYSNFVSRVLYVKKTRVKIMSTLIFTLLFVLICTIFELIYPRTMGSQINNLIDNFFWLGVK
jgi:hypothetical protein